MLAAIDKIFAPKGNRKISVEDSTSLRMMQHELQQMNEQHRADIQAWSRVPTGYNSLFAVSFDGEKTMGGIGPAQHYAPEYEILRARSWQAYLDSDVAQTIINAYILWVLGSGLTLECEPNLATLNTEKINWDDNTEAEFEKITEARYRTYAGSTMGDIADMVPLHKLAERALKCAIVGGDVLVIQRYIKGVVKAQLIDGAHIYNPAGMSGMTWDMREACYILENGNRLVHGVELDANGQHVAYYVNHSFNDYERIPARDKTNGHRRAYLVYGLEYRIDNVRGIPLISVVMEKLKKMERYEDATLAGAEERAKMPFIITHEASSTGENPLAGSRLAQASGFSKTAPPDANGNEVARQVSISVERTVHNMPIGSDMKAVDSKQSDQFKDFFTTNADLVCASVSIPPNVAFGKYDSNYSASRAAIKGWEHTMLVRRADFARQFYQYNYEMWLDMEILGFKITADGYLMAKARGNSMALAAIRKARWSGPSVPHIDPVKEVTAVRMKMGPAGANIPLLSPEDAAEALNGGDLNNNIQKLGDVLQKMKDKGITVDTVAEGTDEEDEEEEQDDDDNKKEEDQ